MFKNESGLSCGWDVALEMRKVTANESSYAPSNLPGQALKRKSGCLVCLVYEFR